MQVSFSCAALQRSAKYSIEATFFNDRMSAKADSTSVLKRSINKLSLIARISDSASKSVEVRFEIQSSYLKFKKIYI